MIPEPISNHEHLEYSEQLAPLLQQCRLPSSLDIGPGYSIAAAHAAASEGWRISSDFYNVIRAGKHRTAILIGEARGKGVRAMITAATIQSIILEELQNNGLASGVLARAGAILSSQLIDLDHLARVLLVILDPHTGRISYASAGCPAALVLRSSGEVRWLEYEQMFVDMPGVHVCEEHRCRFDLGDKLVLCTGGVSRALSGSGIIDLEYLRRVVSSYASLPAGELAHAVVETAMEKTGGNLSEDATALGIEHLGGSYFYDKMDSS